MKNSKLKIYLVILFILLFVSAGVFAAFSGHIFTKKSTTNTASIDVTDIPTAPPSGDPSNPIIAKVGDEYIYKRDLDIELINFTDKSDSVKQQIKEKIALDSQIIQGGLKGNVFSFSSGDKIIDDIYGAGNYSTNTVYNNPQKDYDKRIKLVTAIKSEVNSRLIAYKGSCISVWYVNGVPGPLGYDGAKKLAQERINQIHADVVSGKLTIKEAGDQIRNDPSYEQLDPNYQVNGYVEFAVAKSDPISVDDKLGNILKSSNINDITEVDQFESKNYLDQTDPAFFSFCQLTYKNTNVEFNSYPDWENNQKNLFKAMYF